MPQVKVLARDWTAKIKTGEDATTGTAIFTLIRGLSTLTFSGDKEDADTTGFDDGGRGSHLVASRGNSVSLEGFYLVDRETGARDPGQQAVEDLADKVGYDSLDVFQITDPAGNMKEFQASAGLGDQGGGVNDPTSWSAELTVSGAITKTPAV